MDVRAKLWTRDEYERLVATGALPAETRVQLVQGEIVEMTPQSAAHAAAVELALAALQAVFGPGWWVRVQLPLALGADSEPEPDVAVVTGAPRTRMAHHPSTAALVVEVADTTLEFDRTRKKVLYARAQIPEYWIINLLDGLVEVYRNPQESTYRIRRNYKPGELIAPLAAADTPIEIASLLP